MALKSTFNGGGQVSLSFDKGQLDWINKALKNISPKKRGGVMEQAIQKVGFAAERELKQRVLRGEILHVRSGRLRQSIGTVVTRRGSDIIATVGSGVRSGNRVPYANIHETGGVIKPKPGNKTGFLWIPIRAGSGVAIAAGLSSKRVSFSSKVVGYARVRSVTIPARRYMSITVERVDRVSVAIILKEIDREVEKG